jgi:hypothetical protein
MFNRHQNLYTAMLIYLNKLYAQWIIFQRGRGKLRGFLRFLYGDKKQAYPLLAAGTEKQSAAGFAG